MNTARLACLAATVVLMTAANVNASYQSKPAPPAATPPAAVTVMDPALAHAIVDSVIVESTRADVRYVIEVPDGWCVLGWTLAGMFAGGGLGGLLGMTFGYLVC